MMNTIINWKKEFKLFKTSADSSDNNNSSVGFGQGRPTLKNIKLWMNEKSRWIALTDSS